MSVLERGARNRERAGTAGPIGIRASDDRPVLLPVVLGLLATALAATGSWIPSLWGDEAATAMSAQRSWSSLLLELSRVDAVHGTYYALMHCWVGLVGASPFALRFPSALALGAAVAGVVVLTRISGGSTGTAIAAALSTTLMPRLSYQGEEARAYAIDAAVATWIVVAACATIRGRLRPRTGWVLVGILTVVGTYCFLYVGIMLAVVGVLVLGGPARRRHVRAWLLTVVTTVVATTPILVLGLRERSQVAFLAHRTTTDPSSLLVTVFFSSAAVAVVGWTLVVLALVLAVATWRRRRAGRPWGDDDGPSLALVGAAWGLLPMIVLVGMNPVLHEFSPRYATFAAPGIAVLVGLGLAALGRTVARWSRGRPGALGIAVLALALVAPTWAAQRTPTAFNRSDWASIGELVRTHALVGDQVAFDESVRPSRRELLAVRTYPADFAGLREVQVTTPFWAAASWDDQALTVDQAVAAGRFSDGRVWLLQDAHAGVDTEGQAALRHDGFRIVRSWRAPTSELVELER